MKIFLISISILASLACKAQQDPQYSQYMFNMLSVNPGYAGSRNVLSVTALHRNQWVGIEGAPKTTSITADMPVLNNKIGIGVSGINDIIGRFNNSSVNLYASYRLRTDAKGTLGMGLSIGANMLQANLSGVRTNPQGTSEIGFQDYKRTAPAFGVGFFYNRNKWYLGLSSPNLLNTFESKYSQDNNVIRKFQHYFLSGGFMLGFGNEVKLKPSFMLKGTQGAPLALDVNANLWFHDVIGIGASYRIQNTAIGMVEIQASPQLRFGYALDLPMQGVKTTNGSIPLTHEFLLRYEFGIQQKKVLSPRYF